MAAPSDDLYLLVKSMTRTEKGYFKKLFGPHPQPHSGVAGSKKAKDFVELFDLLDRMKDYNEERLHKAFGTKQKQANLSVLKAYLTEQILKSLRLYHQTISVEFEILGQIQELHLLKSKKLDHLMARRLEKVKKASHAIGNISLEKYLLWFENFTRNTSTFPELFLSWEKIHVELDRNVKDAQERVEIYTLFRTVEKKYREEIGFGKNKTEEIKKLRANPLLDLKYKIHFVSAIIRNYILSMLCLTENDAEGSYQLHKMNLEISRAHPEYIENNVSGYLGLLDSNIRMACSLKKYDDAEKLLQLLDKIKPTNDFDHDYNRSIHYEVILQRAVDTRKFNLNKNQLDEIGEFYRSHPEVPAPMQYARLIIAFYSSGNFSESIDWANAIIAMKDPKRQYDFLQVLARCILMIIYFEDDNSSLVESQLNSARFYFKTHGIESSLCTTLGAGLLKIMREIDKKKRKALFAKLAEQLKKIPDAASSNPELGMFDFGEWCKGKF